MTSIIDCFIQNFRPVIIAIMNESFADLNVVGNLPVDEEILCLKIFHLDLAEKLQ